MVVILKFTKLVAVACFYFKLVLVIRSLEAKLFSAEVFLSVLCPVYLNCFLCCLVKGTF
jgi:hypothetical protein